MESCVFCKIVEGSIPANIVAQTDSAIAIQDIEPQAPVHLLIIPKRHIQSLRELDDERLGGQLLSLAVEAAKRQGLEEAGFRVITNDGQGAGQSVFHLHFHVLGGKSFGPGIV
jgi:histidine triad (HIT) family protein